MINMIVNIIRVLIIITIIFIIIAIVFIINININITINIIIVIIIGIYIIMILSILKIMIGNSTADRWVGKSGGGRHLCRESTPERQKSPHEPKAPV